MKAIILCGGFGTRLGVLTKNTPKPILNIADRPFIFYILDHLIHCGIKEIILSVGFQSDKIIKLIGKDWKGCPVHYSIEDEPLGTGGAIKKAMIDFSLAETLVLNGDSYLDFDIKKLIEISTNKNIDIALILKELKNTSRYGTVVTNQKNQLISFEEKKEGKTGFINTGIYLINNRIFDRIDIEVFSFEQDLMVPFCSSFNTLAIKTDAYFIDIGVPEDFENAQIAFKRLKNILEKM